MKGRALLVGAAALACLGAAALAGEAWWAQRLARSAFEPASPSCIGNLEKPWGRQILLRRWRSCPCWGRYDWGLGEPYACCRSGFILGPRKTWIPRGAYPATLRLATGEDLGGDPARWEAWFASHPALRWDGKLNRLVDAAATGGDNRKP